MTNNYVRARVCGEERDRYRVWILETNQKLWAEIKGSLRFNAYSKKDLPIVGDWVHLEGGKIVFIEERKSLLERKAVGGGSQTQPLAANVDTAFILSSLNADLNERRIERYLSLVYSSGITPVLILSKSDLVENPQDSIDQLQSIALGAAVYAVNVLNKSTVEILYPYLSKNQTVVLLGSSGVGKSSLLNFLMGEDVAETNEIRMSDEKGKHTTTSRQMYEIPQGGVIIDTPGMRELGLSDDAGEGLQHSFSDIEELRLKCKFSNCQHKTEPGCAVRAAIEIGQLEEDRLNSFLKLQKEIGYHSRKANKAAQSEQKKGWKKISKEIRKKYKTY